jgi:hypothetical protein
MGERAETNAPAAGRRSPEVRCLADHPLAARFEQFIDEANKLGSPFYARLSAFACQDAEILSLASRCRSTPVPNLFFSAIHYLLRRNDDHGLAEYFPSLRASPRQDELLFSSLKDFCNDRAVDITPLLAARRVQTNEVNRCGIFLPAFNVVFELAGRRPLALIDVGTSAGLNLLWDKFAYSYDSILNVGPSDSSVHIHCQLIGSARPPVPATFPPVLKRIGFDLQPVDVHDPDQRLWLESLVWPDHPHRLVRLKAAIDIALRTPLELVRGDARMALPSVVANIPRDLTCCLFHSASFNQLDGGEHDAIDQQLIVASANRDIYRIAAEFEQLVLHTYRGGEAHKARALASFDSHGRSLAWGTG